jgi:hypothetical protein
MLLVSASVACYQAKAPSAILLLERDRTRSLVATVRVFGACVLLRSPGGEWACCSSRASGP